jgi:signal transduction histidine kinase
METLMEKGLRILVLEDRPTDAEIQLRELRENGIVHSAKRVETEQKFLLELESWSPDLILADYSLPAFDGLSALLLTRERSPEIPFIFVTGTMGEEVAIETLKNGATDYVLKQRLSRLVPAVRRALREAEDLRKRREAEEALRKETLERLRALEELHEKNQLLIQQSRQAAMGEMINNIAHQWRQPLNTLGLTIQQLLLFYDLGDFTRESLEKCVGSSMELIRHMSQTINDFRNYLRPDKEKVEFKVRGAIENTLSLLEGSLRNPPISVEIVAKDDPVTRGYPNEFSQVLLNILINARDALSEREIDDPMVMITIRSEGVSAVVTVADNAGGIPDEIMGKIFEPYFTTKGPQEGTGVGLFMSKAIIEKNMGGKLGVRNIANGAEFRIEV